MPDLVNVYFTSRNKDNKNLTNFKSRGMNFLAHDLLVRDQFDDFVAAGLPGEFCRLYVSVNTRDATKTQLALQHYLLDHPETDLVMLPSKLASLAAKPENALTKKWLFDFDEDNSKLDLFLADVKQFGGFSADDLAVYPTVNHFSVVVPHGFDTRKLLELWPNVELKRDDYLCLAWGTK